MFNVAMDEMQNQILRMAVPRPFVKFLGIVPEPSVKPGEGGPVAQTDVTVNDVLLGRGSSLGSHKGNIQFRFIILKTATKNADKIFKRNEKTFESSKIVALIRNLTPPGRFLSKNEKSGYWEEVGDSKARKKVAQAFRDFSYAAIRGPASGVASEAATDRGRFCSGIISRNDKPCVDNRRPNPVPESVCLTPSNFNEHDVLLGRGIRKYNGNALFLQLVTQNLTKYCNATLIRKMKSCIAAEIVATIRNLDPPGRFLCKSNETGFWEDIGDDRALKKVAQAFRDCYSAAMKNNSGRMKHCRTAAANYQFEHRTPIPNRMDNKIISCNDPQPDGEQRLYSGESHHLPLQYSYGVNSHLFTGRVYAAIFLPII